MLEETVKIPDKRIAVLVGIKGQDKRMIEKAAKAKLTIDSETGSVTIALNEGDAVNLDKAVNLVKAIARGFSPEKALLLLNDEYYFDLIDLREEIGKSPKALARVKSRVIGKQGKMREQIEAHTSCFVSVFGNTIALIGKIEEIETAKHALEMIIGGSQLTSVLKFLNKGTSRTQEIDF